MARSDDSMRWLAPVPDLAEPVLVVMLTGWIDAGGSAHAAVAAIEDEGGASPIVEFDDDVYVDYRARRPTMELREGLHSVLEWERITLSIAHDQTGRDVLVLAGPEPDMAWHRFTRAVGEVATQLGVRQMVHLGAYPFAVPHTRSPRLSVSSPSQDVLSRVSFLRSSIDVPAGVAAALEREMHDRSVPALGIWAQVPHYISGMSYPAASVALLDGLREATGLVFDGATLRSEVLIQGQRLDQLVAGNAEHEQMLEQLEQIYDASDDTISTFDVGPGLEMRSGDELAEELQQFLRDQD
ncbi:MAG: PAC2 family protein [Ilumatobacter sp.]|nr:PAC2 family protein [Ilumatobacter sp.]